MRVPKRCGRPSRRHPGWGATSAGRAAFRAASALGLAAALVNAPAMRAAAQELGEIQGRVVDGSSGMPVPGATVSIDDLTWVAVTTRAGGFVIPRVTVGERTVRVEATGYAAITAVLPVAPGRATGVTLEVEPFAGALEEMLVTAERSRPTLGALSRLDSADIDVELPPDGKAAELIGGRIPGAVAVPGGSQPGAGYRLLLRGVNSLGGRNDPVIYVDGVRLTSGQAGALLQGVSSRGSLDFLDPSDIARVEVIKGPSASARFGMGASGGVVLIYTKQGGPRRDA